MLEPVNWWEGERHYQVGRRVRYSDRLPGVFRCRMEQLEAVHRWLAAYFHAVAILLQIPGAAEYRWTEDERTDFWDFIWTNDTHLTRTLLATALGNLDAKELMREVPGGERYRSRKLPNEVHLRLAALGRNGLLNVVAECLDRLLVVPELKDEAELYGMDAPPRRWWWPFERTARSRKARVRARSRSRTEDC